MKFEKPIMTMTELIQMGFTRDYLTELTRLRGQRFCWRQNPMKAKSPFLFDTEELAKYIEDQEKLLSANSRRRA